MIAINMSVLREFIKESIGVNSFFGLDRHVSMNALANTISGPHPIDSVVTLDEDDTQEQTSYNALYQSLEEPSSTDYLRDTDEEEERDSALEIPEDETIWHNEKPPINFWDEGPISSLS